MSRHVVRALLCCAVLAGGSAVADDCSDRGSNAGSTADSRCGDRDETAAGKVDRDGSMASSRGTETPEPGAPARTSYLAPGQSQPSADADKYRYGPDAPYDPYGPSPDTWRALP